jgi:molybdopterin-guanine dinucleotide biosynthesis protein A
MSSINRDEITGIILAGGLGSRMGKVNKGLQLLHGEPMVMHITRILCPQVESVMINANHDVVEYEQFNQSVHKDLFPDFAGPLAGIHVGLKNCTTQYLLSVPCDAPFLPIDLATKLAFSLEEGKADIAIAYTKEKDRIQYHPVFCLMKSNLCPHLENFIQQGGRKVTEWQSSLKVANTYFEDAEQFQNINHVEELNRANKSKIIRSKPSL